MKNIVIRIARITDARRLLEIYTPYVMNTAISFEYEVPTLIEFQKRIEDILKKYPYLVALVDGKIVGYAYISAFKTRAAYQWAVETSIYLDCNYKGSGIGTCLYQRIEEIAKRQNIINMNACITVGNPESIAFHKRLGYRKVAYFTKCGYKLDQWHDMIWMEKMIAKHPLKPERLILFEKVANEFFDDKQV